MHLEGRSFSRGGVLSFSPSEHSPGVRWRILIVSRSNR
jgi:hypothetical protein